MTASALSSDHHDCLAAGMDDFISKPISIQPVAEAFARAKITSKAAIA